MNKEDISGLMDGEVTPDACRELLDELGRDHELRRTWGRYHLIGELLRGAEAAPADASTRAPLRAVPQTATPVPRSHRAPDAAMAAAAPHPRRTPYASWAIAAGIAALALTVVIRPPEPASTSSPQLARSVDTGGTAPVPARFAVTNEQPPMLPTVSFTNEQRMNGYLVNFNEQRARLGVPGVHPYVRIVGFEPR